MGEVYRARDPKLARYVARGSGLRGLDAGEQCELPRKFPWQRSTPSATEGFWIPLALEFWADN